MQKQDYKTLAHSRLTDRHRSDEAFLAILDTLVEIKSQRQQQYLNIADIFLDIDKSEGKNLDLIGKLIGEERTLVNFIDRSYFGFLGARLSESYDVGYWYSLYKNKYGTLRTLTDEEYRRVLKARVVKNSSNNNRNSFLEVLNILLDNDSAVIVESENNTAIEVRIKDLDGLTSYYLSKYKSDNNLIPIPLGRRLSVNHQSLPVPTLLAPTNVTFEVVAYKESATATLASLFDSAEKGFAYNFQDLSTLWQDVAGTIPVTTVDQFIARIDDISGNGNHLIQENSAKRPQLKQDAEGYYAWFDGTKAMYTADVVDTSTLLNFAYIVRMTKEVSNTAIVLESSINFNSIQPSFAVLQDSNNISVAKSGYDYTSASVLLDSDSLILSNFDLLLSGSKIPVLRINGVEKARTATRNDASLALGGFRVYVGARAGTSLYLTSKVRAIGFVGRMLTTQEITDVESVLIP